MKKFLILVIALLLSPALVMAGNYTKFNSTEIEMTTGDKQEGRDAFRISDGTSSGNSMFRVTSTGEIGQVISGQTRFYVDASGNIYQYDSSGNLTYYSSAAGDVVIDSYEDLSTWSSASSGQSYFQMEAGKTYIVDMQKIYESGANPAGATGFLTTTMSAVSALLPLATSSNDKLSTTVIWATTGDLAGGSGTTALQVWPAAASGATQYRTANQTTILGSFQNMTGQMTSGSSVVSSGYTGSLNIDAYGEAGTWKLFYDSAVSAQMIDRDLP